MVIGYFFASLGYLYATGQVILARREVSINLQYKQGSRNIMNVSDDDSDESDFNPENSGEQLDLVVTAVKRRMKVKWSRRKIH